jgi:hypothetical protein
MHYGIRRDIVAHHGTALNPSSATNDYIAGNGRTGSNERSVLNPKNPSE